MLISCLNLGGIIHNVYVLQLLCLVSRQWNIQVYTWITEWKICFNMHCIIHDFLLMKINWKIVYKNMSSWIMIITNLISTVFTFPEYNVHDDVSSVLLCLHGRKLIYMCLNPNLFCIKCTCTHDLNFIVITSLHQYAYVRYYCFYLKAIQTLWWNICKYK